MWHLVVLILHLSTLANGVPQVPCYFIFGDSLFDNGNNNHLQTKAKANYPPYGIDFPGGTTGRFTNGRNIADVLAELLGFDNYIPSFASTCTTKGDEDILQGVNYASGGAGIRNETAERSLGAVVSMNQQLLNHQKIVSNILRIKGDKNSASEYLSKCIYTVGIGSNDYINNYFLPQFYPTMKLHTPEEYATSLIQEYSQQLKVLYEYGARKIVVFGLGLIGCTPGSVAVHGTNGSPCVNSINDVVQLFNAKLLPLVDALNKQLQDTKFIYVNLFGISSNPIAEFMVSDTPCCEVATIDLKDGILTCTRSGTSCPDRTTYIFWDATHPTEIGHVYLAQRSYKALLPSDAYPFDIFRLAHL